MLRARKEFLRTTIRRMALLAMLGAVAAPVAGAVGLQGVSVTVEPIIGYERAYKAVPSPHTNARLIYGLRALAGYSILSGELEATRANDNESYPTQLRTIDETSDKLKLGIRSSVGRSFVSGFFRAGGQAQRISRTDTILGIASTSEDPIAIRPYAGLGVELGASWLRLSAAATVVFRDTTAWTRNDVETTVGIRIGR